MIIEVLTDAFLDTLRLIPFLFLTYLLMEFLEHKTEEKSKQMIQKAGRFGPFVGGIIGVIPQCGVSAAASGFYAGGVISVGTLLAIFLSTSDEMLPIFISEAVGVTTILKILGAKVVIGAVSGFAVDLLWRRKENKKDFHDLCEADHCHCEEGSILKSAFWHTVQITVFIFLISLAIGFLVEIAGQERIGGLVSNIPVIGVFLAALIGMIPNCAASVVITQMYLGGMLSTGQMMAGLLAGAGVGTLVLYRTNKCVRENLQIIGILYIISVFWGILFEFLKVTF